MFRLTVVLLYLASCISFVCAVYHEATTRAPNQPVPNASYVVLPVDHFGKSNLTFQNRYWVTDEFYKEGGPVFLLDVGEVNAAGMTGYLTFGHGNDAVADIAKRFHGLIILWEHRYYGNSYPGYHQINGSGTPDQFADYYKYLTFEQAMEDVVVFANNFSMQSHPQTDLRPNSTPWVFIGASYSGNRATWMRIRNPEVVYASLSSSAPVQIQTDFWQYWVALERILADSPSYSSCAIDVHAFARWSTNVVAMKQDAIADAFFSSIKALKYTKPTMNSTAAWLYRMVLFQEVFSAPLTNFQWRGFAGGLGYFCDNLKASNFTGDSMATALDLADGVVSYYGLNRSLIIYSRVIDDVITKQLSNNTIQTTPGQLPVNDMLSWQWQCCSEAGYFETANLARPTNLVPGFFTTDYWIQTQCVSQFGATVASGPTANGALTNKKYSGWLSNTTNVFYTNGEYDPWRALSIASDISAASPARQLTQFIPPANKLAPNGQVFGYVIPKGMHGSDLSYNLSAVATNASQDTVANNANVAHEIFASALSSWLPAYTKFPVAMSTTNLTVAGTITATGTASRSTTTSVVVATRSSNGTTVAPATAAPTPSKPSGATSVTAYGGLCAFVALFIGITVFG